MIPRLPVRKMRPRPTRKGLVANDAYLRFIPHHPLGLLWSTAPGKRRSRWNARSRSEVVGLRDSAAVPVAPRGPPGALRSVGNRLVALTRAA